MKSLYIILVVLIMIIAGDVAAYKYLDNTATQLDKQVTITINDIQSDRWNDAVKGINAVKNKWSKMEFLWTILVDHNEMDEIEQSITRSSNYIKSKDKTLSLAESNNLKRMIKHIPENEALKIENVL